MKMTEEHKEFLDELRDSGITNMWGAPTYLADEFGLTKQDSRDVVKQWMESFNE